MKNMRYYIVILLLLVTGFIAYGLPRVKYTGSDMLSKLDIPYRSSGWISKDMSQVLDLRDMRYNFISKVFVRMYMNQYRENLLFLILDAGNFHHPKMCFTGSGASVMELPDKEFQFGSHKVTARVLYSQKPGESQLLVYWICIDKKLTDWTGQKVAQLYYSMFNKQKVGFMMRLDIPCYAPERIESRLKLAQEFLSSIYAEMPHDQREYVFGK